MVDAVSYIGDILSFYLDYQANESFLSTAIEYDNVLKHGETVGYRYQPRRSSFGDINLFLIISFLDADLLKHRLDDFIFE